MVISQAGPARSAVLSHKWRRIPDGADWAGRSQERPTDGGGAGAGDYDRLHHFIADGKHTVGTSRRLALWPDQRDQVLGRRRLHFAHPAEQGSSHKLATKL